MLATSRRGGVRPRLTRTVLQETAARTSPACPWGCSGGHGRSWLLCSHLAFSTMNAEFYKSLNRKKGDVKKCMGWNWSLPTGLTPTPAARPRSL